MAAETAEKNQERGELRERGGRTKRKEKPEKENGLTTEGKVLRVAAEKREGGEGFGWLGKRKKGRED